MSQEYIYIYIFEKNNNNITFGEFGGYFIGMLEFKVSNELKNKQSNHFITNHHKTILSPPCAPTHHLPNLRCSLNTTTSLYHLLILFISVLHILPSKSIIKCTYVLYFRKIKGKQKRKYEIITNDETTEIKDATSSFHQSAFLLPAIGKAVWRL